MARIDLAESTEAARIIPHHRREILDNPLDKTGLRRQFG